jgi:hypothetical protein
MSLHVGAGLAVRGSMTRNLRASIAIICFGLAAVGPLAGCAGHATEAAEDGYDESNLRESTLPASSKLRQETEAIATEWGDANIMNGSVGVRAARLRIRGVPRDSSLVSSAKTILESEIADDGVAVQGELVAEVLPSSEALQVEAAHFVGVDGLCYSDNRDNIEPLETQVKGLVKLLGDSSKLRVVKFTGKSIADWSDSEDLWAISFYCFVNTETGELVSFYAREGWT